jgi:hypothetical protein
MMVEQKQEDTLKKLREELYKECTAKELNVFHFFAEKLLSERSRHEKELKEMKKRFCWNVCSAHYPDEPASHHPCSEGKECDSFNSVFGGEKKSKL